VTTHVDERIIRVANDNAEAAERIVVRTTWGRVAVGVGCGTRVVLGVLRLGLGAAVSLSAGADLVRKKSVCEDIVE
jgi:hypothetical protein